MSLAPPAKVRKLQETLHAKAKGSPGYRFYLLYDKVYRRDVLDFAFDRCRTNGDAGTPLGVLAAVACTRHRVEDFLEDGKSYMGMAQYETRSYVGWHHHMTPVGLAHLFVVLTRLGLEKRWRA